MKQYLLCKEFAKSSINNIGIQKDIYNRYENNELVVKKEEKGISIFTPEILKILCLANGFEVVDFYTDFDLKEKLNKHSDKSKKRLRRLILVAKKVK